MNSIKAAYKRIKHMLSWFPVIWKDYDFDYHFIIQILKFKIERTRKHIDGHKLFEGYEEVVCGMLKCEKRLDDFLNNTFTDEADMNFEKTYGKIIPRVQGNEFKMTFPEPQEFTKIKYLELMKEAEEASQRNWEDAINIIKNNIYKWWD